MFDLSGRVALVTGAGQNIGAGIARMLAAHGAAIAVNDVVPERAKETVTAIEQAGGQAVVAPFDVTDRGAVEAGVTAVAETLGPVDILVNNAGNGGASAMPLGPFREMDPSSWEGAIRVNLDGVMP
jgi:3-oxoacyl-[acyl-carrier protein] reductase